MCSFCDQWSVSQSFHYLRRRRSCFHFGLFVCLFECLSVCLSIWPSDNWKSCERILTKFLGGVGMAQGPMSSILVTIRITVRIQESVPDFEIPIHWIIEKVTNGFWWNIMESWGVAYRPTDYIRITVRIQESEVRNRDSLGYRLCWRSAEVCALWSLRVNAALVLLKATFLHYFT